MSNHPTTQQVVNAIEAGEYDETQIARIAAHLEFRRQQNALDAAQTLGPGAQVRISQSANLRPRYVLGTLATIVRVNKKTATIRLGEVRGPAGGRFRTGQEIRCPLTAIEAVA